MPTNTTLNGTAYGIENLIFEIKRGAVWEEDFFFEGDLSDGEFRGYIANKREGDRLAEFEFSTPEFGDYTDANGDPLEGFTVVKAKLPSSITESIPTTPIAPSQYPKAGKDYWEADIEVVLGDEVIWLLSAIVYVKGQC